MGWNVRAFDIYRLSQQDYWDVDVNLIGIKALHPTRRTGHRYVSAEHERFNPHKAVMVEEDRRRGKVQVFDIRGIPDGYSVTARGLIEQAQSVECQSLPRRFKVEEVEEPSMADVPTYGGEEAGNTQMYASASPPMDPPAAPAVFEDGGFTTSATSTGGLRFEPAGFVSNMMHEELEDVEMQDDMATLEDYVDIGGPDLDEMQVDAIIADFIGQEHGQG